MKYVKVLVTGTGLQVTVENYFLVPDTGKHCRRNNTFLRDSAHYAEISTCKQKLCTIHDLLFPRLTNKNTPTLVT